MSGEEALFIGGVVPDASTHEHTEGTEMSTWSRRDFLRAGLGVAAAGTVGTVLASCSSGPASAAAGSGASAAGGGHAAKGTISVWMHKEAAFQKVYEKLVAEFEHSHPGAKVTSLYIPFTQLGTKTMTAFIGGNPPDVAKLNGTSFAEFSSRGMFAPVDPSAMGFSSLGDFKSAFEPNTTLPLEYKGKIYGVPITWNALFLVYNKDDFRAAGLNPTKPPATWEDLVPIAQKLTKYKPTGAVTRAGFQWTFDGGTQWTFLDLIALVAGKGGTILKGGKGNLSTKVGIEALTYYQDLCTKYKVCSPNLTNPTYDPGMFAKDQMSMALSSNWATPLIEAINPALKEGTSWGIAPMPKWKGGKTVTPAYTWGWAVARRSKNSALAWEFVRFMESRSSAKRILETAAIIEPIKEWQSLVPHTPGSLLEAQSSATTVYGPSEPYWSKMAQALTSGLQSLARGETTPAKMAAQFDGTNFA